MNRMYETLKDDERFRDALGFDESSNCLSIGFHEYVWLEYYEGDYTSASNEGLMQLGGGSKHVTFTAHWHITNDDEACKALNEFFDEELIYIENTRLFTIIKLRTMKKERFEKRKDRFMANKALRIYSAFSILKRSE